MTIRPHSHNRVAILDCYSAKDKLKRDFGALWDKAGKAIGYGAKAVKLFRRIPAPLRRWGCLQLADIGFKVGKWSWDKLTGKTGGASGATGARGIGTETVVENAHEAKGLEWTVVAQRANSWTMKYSKSIKERIQNELEVALEVKKSSSTTSKRTVDTKTKISQERNKHESEFDRSHQENEFKKQEKITRVYSGSSIRIVGSPPVVDLIVVDKKK